MSLRFGLLVVVAGAILIALAITGITFGATPLAVGDVIRTLTGHADGVAGPVARIVLDLRLPRVLLAICVGGGLAVTGCLLQTATRNDLADPFLFGLSAGAATGAAFVIGHWGDALGIWTLPIAALAGTLLSAAAVLIVTELQPGRGPERLVIVGIAVSFLFSALTSYLVFAGDQRAAHSVLFWSLGGLGLAAWHNLPLAAIGLVVAVLTALMHRHALDGLLAGEETALSLGIDAPHLRRRIFLLCALSTSTLVSVAGVVGFIGLMIPHIARALIGVRHGPLAILAALIGAAFLLAGDLGSRLLLAPQELPVGILTAAVGAVFILALVMRG
ncbi:ABC transporter permease [Elstera litoralis]|uniref:ABC transporter permease n=1 Tax=Elstera litoralis TaxID=552518 RepID=A0A0F3IRN3_9PROT|nr:iron ABC transporter permease [Elstera litoralis]KJV09203.1 ABC transporter permease [Elstera litoralis]